MKNKSQVTVNIKDGIVYLNGEKLNASLTVDNEETRPEIPGLDRSKSRLFELARQTVAARLEAFFEDQICDDFENFIQCDNEPSLSETEKPLFLKYAWYCMSDGLMQIENCIYAEYTDRD